jgi:hypothetical protein
MRCTIDVNVMVLVANDVNNYTKNLVQPRAKPTDCFASLNFFLNRITGFLDLQYFCFAKAKLNLQDFVPQNTP